MLKKYLSKYTHIFFRYIKEITMQMRFGILTYIIIYI